MAKMNTKTSFSGGVLTFEDGNFFVEEFNSKGEK